MTPKKDAAPAQKKDADAGLPIHSMTGFARASERLSETLGYTLSLKSVNHRFLDLHMRMPSGTDSLEMQLRKVLKEKIARGHVEVSLSIDRSGRTEAQYDAALVTAYVTAFRNAASQHDLNSEPD